MKKKILFFLFLLSHYVINAQSKNNDHLIEGGKTLLELINVIKKAKPGSAPLLNDKKNIVDSCATKQIADLCFKNSSSKNLVISIYKRNEGGYETQPFTMKVIAKRQECWYELRCGIYKYKIETDSAGIKAVFSEGELKLQSCDNMEREITE